MKEKTEQKITNIPRKGGWFYTEDGYERLKEGGLRGHALFEKSMFEQIGERCRVRFPVRTRAVEIIRSVKGVAKRAVWLSEAILTEIAECGTGEINYDAGKVAYPWMIISQTAYDALKGRTRPEVCDIITNAVMKAALPAN